MWKPDFSKIDLLALYITMYLKRIVVNKLPWKEHLNILYEEVSSNLDFIGREKEQYLYPTLRDFARVYNYQWSVKELGQEVGQPTFHTLLLVLSLRLGLQKLWVPDSLYFREDILIEGFLSQKPKLNLTYLSQGEPLYDNLVPLCPNLLHISMPISDNATFIKTVSIKTLRVLEFSTGVADKVLCSALWNIEKKSDKVLQMAVKDTKEGSFSLALPHLEVLRSNIHIQDNGAGSMKLTLGAAALILQPKLRIVENRNYWSTLQAIHELWTIEEKYKIQSKRRLAVDQLVFDYCHTEHENFTEHFTRALETCPNASNIIFTECSVALPKIFKPLIKLKSFSQLEKLSLDVTLMSERELQNLLLNIGGGIKHLTLKVSMALINKFCAFKYSRNDELVEVVLPSLNHLSLVLCDKIRPKCDGSDYTPTSMISFLSWFWRIRKLSFYNVMRVPPIFVVYECIGGAVAIIQELKHLAINGYTMLYPSDVGKMPFVDEEVQVQDMLPELMSDATFEIIKTLDSFELDEAFLSAGVDRFLDVLRTCNVHVQIMYRPQSVKRTDPARYFNYDDTEFLCTVPRDHKYLQ